uniref:Uncharacterized protein n=1 Tax=Moniliophthora roreri TaxID=221103 RepID=A0A0W0GAE4_MONRR
MLKEHLVHSEIDKNLHKPWCPKDNSFPACVPFQV